MNERTVFLEALDRDTPAGRVAYLDETCAGEPGLRERVESLLRSHEAAGEFLGKPAPQRLAEGMVASSRDPAPDPETLTGPPTGDAASEPLDFLAPSEEAGSLGRLGHYEVLEVVGRGGMGIVLRAFDERLRRVVAIKVMAATLATNANARKRFTREARAAAAVTHDHIVTIHAVEEAGGLPYLVMQFVAGTSLQERLDRTGSLETQEIARIGMQAALGLAAAHAQGLIHRDVKPSNLLLENGVERVKITDFGLARAVDDASLTQNGVVAGTPQYMSPEQARGEAIDHRADLFSLGSVLYAMCTGRPPFRGSGTMAVLKRVCEDEPRPISEVAPETPDWLINVIARLQAKVPADRFQSAAEVAELLSKYLAHLQQPALVALPSAPAPLSVRSQGGAERRLGRRRRWATAVVLVALVAAFGTTEATGVTKVRAAVFQIFSPDGPTEASREAVSSAPEGVTKAEAGAFVLLGGKGIAERKFVTLADAVRGASDGDTIEVHGNGPFVSQPITISYTALTIRGGAGYLPVITLNSQDHPADAPLLQSNSLLVLEGLEFRHLGPKQPCILRVIVRSHAAPLYVANCRFFMEGVATYPLHAVESPVFYVRNSLIVGEVQTCLPLGDPDKKSLIEFDNCVVIGSGGGMALDSSQHDEPLRLTRNTVIAAVPIVLFVRVPGPEDVAQVRKPRRLDLLANVFDGQRILRCLQMHEVPKELQLPRVKTRLQQVLSLNEQQNLYAFSNSYLDFTHYYDPAQSVDFLNTLTEWQRFWGADHTRSIEGRPRYKGGNLLYKLATAPERLMPDDFRLRPDSPGYRAGKDGKDLGADVDIVGPGPAYQRWKETPEYQQWLKNTGQLKQ